MKFTANFTTIDHKIHSAIENAILYDINAYPVLICRLSNHPDDWYLYLYIAKTATDEYITGLANTSRNGSVGLYENHYGLTFKRALEILADKIHDCNKEV